MIVAIVTARANSKGLPGKNMKELGGKPLIQHSFDVAVASGVFDKILLSTDIDEAINLAGNYKEIDAPFKRPEHLCGDKVSQQDVVNHALNHLSESGNPATHFVLFQPTAPFRTPGEIREGVNLLKQGKKSVIGVTSVMHHPADYLLLDEDQKVKYLMTEYTSKPRQSFPPIYFNNGAFYGVETDFFNRTQNFYDADSALLMMNEFSLVDIDTQFDFLLASSIVDKFKYAF